MKELQSGKSPGLDAIQAEMVEYSTVRELQNAGEECHGSGLGKIPGDWKKAVKLFT